MSAYEPPTSTYPIFDSLVFQSPNSGTLTQSEADARYLARTGTATSIATSTDFGSSSIVTTGNINGAFRTINTTANATHYLNFSDSSATGNGNIQKTAGLSVNPNTNTINATAFSSLSGSTTFGAGGSTAITCNTSGIPTFSNYILYKQSIVNTTANITPPFSEIYLCTPTANTVWTLTAGNYAGVHIYIRKLSSAFSLQITVTSGLILDNTGSGFGSITLTTANFVCDLVNDGSNWIACIR